MTAEIVIMNKEAVAVAADSAVTITLQKGDEEEKKQKIFVSSNKLFALSKYQPVCVMVYGSASFMGIPWETVVKLYRKKLQKRSYGALRDYAESLLAFLESEGELFSTSTQLHFFEANVRGYFSLIRRKIEKKIKQLISEKDGITEKEVGQSVSRIIQNQHDLWEKSEPASGHVEHSIKELGSKYQEIIRKAKREVFDLLPMSRTTSNQLTRIALHLFVKFPGRMTKPGASGLVIAGFGQDDLFPSLYSFYVHGVMNNRLRYKDDEKVEIGAKVTAAVHPFAQSEMVQAFLWGVDPDYQRAIEEDLTNIFNEYPDVILGSVQRLTDDERSGLRGKLRELAGQELKRHRKKLWKYRWEHYVDPVMSVVDSLPKQELAAMAESLVNLTSFKRRVSVEAETVAEPIDVAVISKGDGFIWIKRKHYFQRELNPQFFANYYREDEDEQKKD